MHRELTKVVDLSSLNLKNILVESIKQKLINNLWFFLLRFNNCQLTYDPPLHLKLNHFDNLLELKYVEAKTHINKVSDRFSGRDFRPSLCLVSLCLVLPHSPHCLASQLARIDRLLLLRSVTTLYENTHKNSQIYHGF